MKNLKNKIILILIMLVFALSSCSLPKLSKPYGLKTDDALRYVYWNPVRGAKGYRVRVESSYTKTFEVEISTNSFDISKLDTSVTLGLDEETEIDYVISVMALGDGSNASNSPWVEIEVFKAYENGTTYKLINNQKEYELTGIGTASGDIIIPKYFRGKKVTSIAPSAFYNSSKLKSITLPDTITTIGAKAFYNCVNLERINIPESVTSIGENCFQKCKKLKEIEIPSKILSIPENAFMGCESLKEIKFNEGLLLISKNAFLNCKSLNEVSFPDSLYLIGELSFGDNLSIEKVSFGKNLNEIRTQAFMGCLSLKDITFSSESNLKYIDNSAFKNNISLTNIIIPDSVIEIGTQAFTGCLSLKDVHFGKSLKTLYSDVFLDSYLYKEWDSVDGVIYAGDYLDGSKWVVGQKTHDAQDIILDSDVIGICVQAFYVPSEVNKETGVPVTANKLRTITLPDSLKYINSYAFYNNVNINYINIPKNVIEIGSQAFYGCSLLSTLTFDDESNLKVIGSGAFQDCKKLGSPTKLSKSYPKDLDLPGSLETIGKDAFKGTYFYDYYQTVVYVGGWVVGTQNPDLIKEVVIKNFTYDIEERNGDATYDEPKDKLTIGIADGAFHSVSTLSWIRLPETIKNIGRSAFYKCSALSTLNIPTSLEVINDYAFYECSNLADVVLPETITYIGRSAFYKCTNMTEVAIPGACEYIGQYAFYKTGLESLTLNEGIKFIDNKAFYDVEGISELIIPESILYIGDYAFSKCYSIENLIVLGDKKEELREIGIKAFAECVSLKDVEIYGGIDILNDYCFKNCWSLRNVIIHDGVKTISKSCFYNCESLEEIYLPDSIMEIGNQAFRGCTLLKSIYIGSNIERVGRHIVYGCDNATIYLAIDETDDSFDSRWNSSFRPVIYNAQVNASSGITYIEKIIVKEGSITSLDNATLSYPTRPGYEVIGLSKDENGSELISIDLIKDLPDDTVLYVIYERK